LGYEEGIDMAGEVLITVTQEERDWARRESEYKYEVDLQSKIVGAKREAKSEEKREIAGKMKAYGIPADQIAGSTGLSLEELSKL
jgi:ERCC4-related helicase